jgi:enoyl-CoA hydratase
MMPEHDASAAERCIRVSVADGIGRVEISNPARRNALSVSLMDELAEALRSLDEDPDVRVLIVRGAGTEAFVSGADIGEFTEQQAAADIRKAAEATAAMMFTRLADVSVPVIARIHGYCMGAGVAVALGADLRIADTRSTYAIPAARLGLGYPLAQTAALVHSIGAAAAGDLLFTGRRVTAREALTLGLVSQVVDGDHVARVVEELAAAIARNAPLSIRAAKAAIRAARISAEAGQEARRTARQLADTAIARCATSNDLIEGASAFLVKRPPAFTGR